jgi:hypothetical protein
MLFNPLRPNKTLNVISNYLNHMGGVMVSMLAWNVVDPNKVKSRLTTCRYKYIVISLQHDIGLLKHVLE